MKKSFPLMIDDGIKTALLPLNYNIGASGREEYKGKQKRDEGKSHLFLRECDTVCVGGTEIKFSCV